MPAQIDAPKAKSSDKSSIQVVDRVVMLLDALAESAEPLALKVVAQSTGLHPSTAHRILTSLCVSGLVARDADGAYSLGIRLLSLGNLVKSRFRLRDVALPFMQRLHEIVGESVNLGIRDGDEIVYVERTSAGRSLVRVVYLVGGRAPLHITSAGKLFLAEMDVEGLQAYVERTGLPGKTQYSLRTLPDLQVELEKIRLAGLSVDEEEAELGLRCVAAPLRDDEGSLLGGLSVSAPTERHRPEWGQLIKKTALDISRAMGYQS